MSSLLVLLRKYKDVHRRHIETERELADLDRQILAAEAPTKRRRRRAVPIEANDPIRDVLRVLRESEAPLPPREIASRLSVDPKLTRQRVSRALRLGYIEHAGNARYRISSVVPSL